MCVCVYIYCVFVRSDVVFRLSNFLFVNFGEIGVEFCTVLFVEIIDGGKNPTFQEKFTFTLIEGLRELNVFVWNSNTLTYDDFIGSGKLVNCSLLMIYQLFFPFFLARFNLKLADRTFAVCTKRVQLQKVLSGGYDDNSSPLQTKTGRWKTSLLGCHDRSSDVFNDLQVSTGLSGVLFLRYGKEWNEHKVTQIGKG